MMQRAQNASFLFIISHEKNETCIVVDTEVDRISTRLPAHWV